MITKREADIPVLPVTLSEPIVKRYRFRGSDDESGLRAHVGHIAEAALRRKTMTAHASNLVHQEYEKLIFTV